MRTVKTASTAAALSAFAAAILTGCTANGGSSLPALAGHTSTAVRSAFQRPPGAPMYAAPHSTFDRAALARQAVTATTIPFFSGSIVSPLDGNTYDYSIAGADPHTSKVTTGIGYVPIVLVIKFSDGVTLDPRQPACGDTVPVATRAFDGPNFVNTPLVSNGVNVGNTQLTDADMRAEFWSIVHGTGYHLKLKSTLKTPLVLTMNAPSGSSTQPYNCGSYGLINYFAFDSLIQSVIPKNTALNHVPVFLTYDTYETEGSACCILGYHNAFARNSGTQVYVATTYSDDFGTGYDDIAPLTHELGEMLNDPFGNNPTPAWGNIGQVSGCQNNLEVGDPLSGTAFPVTYNGFTYNPQELAFFDWFFRTPSEGTGGKYSFEGTFTSTPPACT